MSVQQAIPYAAVENPEIPEAARSDGAFLACEILRRVRPWTALLEVGAGTVARRLAEAGYAVGCVEPDPALRRRLRDAGLTVHDSADHIAAGSVDYIYSLNGLKLDDTGALAQWRTRLRPGGRLLIYLAAGQTRRDRRAVTACVTQAGLELEEIRSCDSLGFLATLAFKMLGPENRPRGNAGLMLYDGVIYPTSRAIDRLCGRLLGKSLIVLARRPAHETEDGRTEPLPLGALEANRVKAKLAS